MYQVFFGRGFSEEDGFGFELGLWFYFWSQELDLRNVCEVYFKKFVDGMQEMNRESSKA